uniref:Rhomboid-related protein 2 n=1 Tax=Oryzias latipes TaxID=8090 RepID=A0A3P9H5M8_ORYLA
MDIISIEQRNPLNAERNDEPGSRARDAQPKTGCWEKLHQSVPQYMLPKELHSVYLEKANCFPPPIFIILISIAELAVFIYYAVWKPQKQWVTLDEGIWNSPLTYRPDHRQEAWRFVSYMFVHAGVEHIVGNLFMQLLVGIPLEMVHKGFEVGMVYMAGVIAGSLASSIFDPFSGLVGASGGVYALLGGYFMNAIVNFREMNPIFRVFRIVIIVFIVGGDFGFALYRRFVAHDNLQVSFVAHLGGIAAGMTIGFVFFSAYNQKLLKDFRFWVCIAGYIVFLFFAVVYNIFISPAP